MKQNEYQGVVNDPFTYSDIAFILKSSGSCIIGWEDEEIATHFDILFVYKTMQFGPLQGGVKGSDLLVSIMRWGSFGFEVNTEELHPGYVGEKLRMAGPTAEKVAALINGIRAEIIKLEQEDEKDNESETSEEDSVGNIEI
jgi:hypothetical protein